MSQDLSSIAPSGMYGGTWQSTDPAAPAVTIRTGYGVVIDNAFIRGVGRLVGAPWSDAHLIV